MDIVKLIIKEIFWTINYALYHPIKILEYAAIGFLLGTITILIVNGVIEILQSIF